MRLSKWVRPEAGAQNHEPSRSNGRNIELKSIEPFLPHSAVSDKALNPWQASIKRFSTFVVLILWVLSIHGCTLIGGRSIVVAGLQGQVENNVYTSPQQSFRFRIPWLTAKAATRDERPTPNSLLVTIEDELCRQYLVSERPGFLGTESLQQWVDAHIIVDLERLGMVNVQRKAIMTSNGHAVALSYRAPGGAPCNQTTKAEGKPAVTQRDADVAWHVYHHNGAFYRLIYVVGIGPGAPSHWYIKREPADEVLGQFAQGFEIIAAKSQTSP